MTTFILLASALLPAIVLLFYILRRDPQPEPRAWLAKAIGYGVLICVPISFVEYAISALLSSSFYYFGSIWKERIDQAARQESKNTGTRSMLVFEEFIRLVNEFHTQERRMSFYADKLCLTPKYLSKIIKQASGRSGPEWIDSYVILEAKNLLRYSDISIKEIVYRLHFPNSSVFYKFFKSKTGMTPSEYRK